MYESRCRLTIGEVDALWQGQIGSGTERPELDYEERHDRDKTDDHRDSQHNNKCPEPFEPGLIDRTCRSATHGSECTDNHGYHHG